MNPDFVGSDAEGKRTNKISSESSGKRCAEEIEPAPTAKRQAFDTGMGTPRSSSLSKTAVLSRDGSFKSLEKGKVRPAALGSHSRNDVSETARSPSGSLIRKAKGTHSLFAPIIYYPSCYFIVISFPYCFYGSQGCLFSVIYY